MTKKEFLKLLEPYPDDTELLVESRITGELEMYYSKADYLHEVWVDSEKITDYYLKNHYSKEGNYPDNIVKGVVLY